MIPTHHGHYYSGVLHIQPAGGTFMCVSIFLVISLIISRLTFGSPLTNDHAAATLVIRGRAYTR